MDGVFVDTIASVTHVRDRCTFLTGRLCRIWRPKRPLKVRLPLKTGYDEWRPPTPDGTGRSKKQKLTNLTCVKPQHLKPTSSRLLTSRDPASLPRTPPTLRRPSAHLSRVLDSAYCCSFAWTLFFLSQSMFEQATCEKIWWAEPKRLFFHATNKKRNVAKIARVCFLDPIWNLQVAKSSFRLHSSAHLRHPRESRDLPRWSTLGAFVCSFLSQSPLGYSRRRPCPPPQSALHQKNRRASTAQFAAWLLFSARLKRGRALHFVVGSILPAATAEARRWEDDVTVGRGAPRGPRRGRR